MSVECYTSSSLAFGLGVVTQCNGLQPCHYLLGMISFYILIFYIAGGNSVEVIATKQEPNTGDHHIQVLCRAELIIICLFLKFLNLRYFLFGVPLGIYCSLMLCELENKRSLM